MLETLSLEILLLLALVGGVAGCIDAIAGGGGLLTLPALLTAGVPPAQALATNKLQSSVGTTFAAWNFVSKGMVDLRALTPAIGCTFLGACLGTYLVQSINPSFLADVIPFLLIAIAVYFLLSPRASDVDAHARISGWAFALMVGFSIGFYDGFFGPGTGSFFAIALVTLRGFGLGKATAATKVLNLTSNLASLAVFILGGKVMWTVGLAMAAGQAIGGRVGSHLVIANGAKIVRPLLVVVCIGITARLVIADPANPLHKALATLLEALL